jgi:D-alanine-D-alanine ligase
VLTRKRIGVLMGGASAEREVSLKTGSAISGALKKLGYNVVDIDVGPDVCVRLRDEKVEVAFMALHGGHGEDGSVQGLLDVMGLPYTGSGLLASALAMDKLASKTFFSACGLNLPRWQAIGSMRERPVIYPPVVVKPSREGSSVGVSIVREDAALKDAVSRALSFGAPALVEEYVKGREVNIGVLGDRVLGGVEIRPTLEFYSYESKYTPGLTKYIIPPELDEDVYEKTKDAALKAHRALGCRGATRVDLLVDEKGVPYMLEVNTIPGMTETSLLPKIARFAGMDFPALIEEILKDALFGVEGGIDEG